jgi:hypothetical protein
VFADANQQVKHVSLPRARDPSRGQPAHSADGYAEIMPGLPRTLTAALHQEEDWYIAQCLEVDVASQGHTIIQLL